MNTFFKSQCISYSVMSSSFCPHGLYSLPGTTVHWIFQARTLEWGLLFPSPRDLPNPGFLHCRWILWPFGPLGKPRSQCITWKVKVTLSDSLQPCELYSQWNSPGQNTGVGRLSGVFPNPGIQPRSPELQADSLPAEPQGKPHVSHKINTYLLLIIYV